MLTDYQYLISTVCIVLLVSGGNTGSATRKFGVRCLETREVLCALNSKSISIV